MFDITKIELCEIKDGFEFKEKFLLYMDVIGVKSHIKERIGKDTLKNVIQILDNYNISQHIRSKSNPDKLYQFTPEISAFSDHVAISLPKSPQLENDGESYTHYSAIVTLSYMAIRLQQKCLELGVLMRGAITVGELLHVKNKIVGDAINEVIELEENTAYYPRYRSSRFRSKRNRSPYFASHGHYTFSTSGSGPTYCTKDFWS